MIILKILILIVFYSSFIILKVIAFYGDPEKAIIMDPIYDSQAITINNTIHLFGGTVFFSNSTEEPNLDIYVYSFSLNGTLSFEIRATKDPRECSPCTGFALPDGDTIAFLNIPYPAYTITAQGENSNEVHPAGLGFYHISNNSWTYGTGPQPSGIDSFHRIGYNSGISKDKRFAYIGWGRADNNISSSMLKFDINNSSNVQEIPTSVFIFMGCSVTLPSGEIVVGFGYDEKNNIFHSTDQVMLYDTNTDSFSWKPVKKDGVRGNLPTERIGASCALGPDQSTIYYFGGSDYLHANGMAQNLYNITFYNDIAMLDTKNWVWILPEDTSGIKPSPVTGSTMTLYDKNKLFISTGLLGDMISHDISVLNNLPLSDPSNEKANKLQWFTNYPDSDLDKNHELSDGAIAGITIAVLVFIALLLTLLWIYVPLTKKIATYIQHDLLWNPRSGEPLWAETARLLVRIILLFLFLAFIVYVIWKSVNSATVTQKISNEVNSVLAPDIRFCFNGFNMSDESTNTFVTCTLRNGTNCSNKIQKLNLKIQEPNYTFDGTTCFLFLPGPYFYIYNDIKGYIDRSSTNMMFNFFAQNTTADISNGVIFVDFYPPGYDPNTDTYGFGKSKVSPAELLKWKTNEQANNAVNTIILKQTVESTATYTLTTMKKLKQSDGWNIVGFSSNYEEYLDITSSFKEIPQNLNRMPSDYFTEPIAQLTVQPKTFTENFEVEQRVFTLLNAFAQAGGVLGLFIAVQTILFGFRPQSPWGIVHRWSFGSLRIKLTDRLAKYFDITGTPVPLVNPVSNRLSIVNGQNIFKNMDNTYVPLGPDTPSASDANGINDHENRVQRVEERLQLMELLLKSYYLNDEVFRSLDQAVKRGNEEKRRSSYMSTGNEDTDSVLNNDGLVNEDMVSDGAEKELNGKPSSVIPQQRDPYQPRLASNPNEFLYDEEHNITGKK